jgi:hypothetical protein
MIGYDDFDLVDNRLRLDSVHLTFASACSVHDMNVNEGRRKARGIGGGLAMQLRFNSPLPECFAALAGRYFEIGADRPRAQVQGAR